MQPVKMSIASSQQWNNAALAVSETASRPLGRRAFVSLCLGGKQKAKYRPASVFRIQDSGFSVALLVARFQVLGSRF